LFDTLDRLTMAAAIFFSQLILVLPMLWIATGVFDWEWYW